MSELIVVGFHGKHRAAEVLDQLQELNETWAVDLKDGVAVNVTTAPSAKSPVAHCPGRE